MNLNKIYYFVLPKGIRGLLYKSYPYITAAVVGYLDTKTFQPISLLEVFILFEVLISPARYILNDIHDYKGDKERGNRWSKPVDTGDKDWLYAGAILRIGAVCYSSLL